MPDNTIPDTSTAAADAVIEEFDPGRHGDLLAGGGCVDDDGPASTDGVR